MKLRVWVLAGGLALLGAAAVSGVTQGWRTGVAVAVGGALVAGFFLSGWLSLRLAVWLTGHPNDQGQTPGAGMGLVQLFMGYALRLAAVLAAFMLLDVAHIPLRPAGLSLVISATVMLVAVVVTKIATSSTRLITDNSLEPSARLSADDPNPG